LSRLWFLNSTDGAPVGTAVIVYDPPSTRLVPDLAVSLRLPPVLPTEYVTVTVISSSGPWRLAELGDTDWQVTPPIAPQVKVKVRAVVNSELYMTSKLAVLPLVFVATVLVPPSGNTRTVPAQPGSQNA
jgi:hypothetical protein